jgi:hypothetical protein
MASTLADGVAPAISWSPFLYVRGTSAAIIQGTETVSCQFTVAESQRCRSRSFISTFSHS